MEGYQSKTKRFQTYGKKKSRLVNVSHQTKPSVSAQANDTKTFSAHALLLAASPTPRKPMIPPRPPLSPRTNIPKTVQKRASTSSFESIEPSPPASPKPKAKPKPKVAIHTAILSPLPKSRARLRPAIPLPSPAKLTRRQPSVRTPKASVISVSSTDSDCVPPPTSSAQIVVEIEPLPFDQLGIQDAPWPAQTKAAVKAPLKPLLAACAQDKPYEFNSFVERALAAGLLVSPPPRQTKWQKLGEATYSEVFVIGSLAEERIVVKIIPLHQPSARKPKLTDDVDTPEVTRIEDALRELEIARYLNDGNGDPGFISLLGAHVVQGSYPAPLLKEWDGYLKSNPSKAYNVRPSAFPASQTYLLLCLPYCGADLETFKLKSWTQAASILWQVASSLERAEATWNFEHRDLHWGNVLVEMVPVSDEPVAPGIKLETFSTPLRRSGGEDWPARLESSRSGVKACIIDYTLSSCDDARGTRRLYGGCDEEELFQGQGDYQYDVYRMMRQVTKGDWKGFHPTTNLLWLHYLAQKLLLEKGLRTAAVPLTPRRASAHTGTKRHQARPKHRESKSERQERHSHEALKAAADMLGEAIERLLRGPPGKGQPDVWPQWSSSSDFCAWWAYSFLFRP